MVRIRWDVKKMLKLKNWKTPWGLNDFVTVTLCALKFPSNLSQVPNPKHWHLSVYCHGSFGLAKASKVRAATWHMIWNSTMARNAGTDFLYPSDENHLFPCPKTTMAGLPTTTVLLTHSGCKNWSGSQSPQCGEKCWVLGPRKDRTRYGSTHLRTESRNATGPLEQYHNERPPAAPETKTFQAWNGYGKIFHVLIINKQRQESS